MARGKVTIARALHTRFASPQSWAALVDRKSLHVYSSRIKGGFVHGGARSHLQVVPYAASALRRHRMAVLIPCYNEGRSIAKVVETFRAALPDAAIFVFDNNSTDDSAAEGLRAGAHVFRETRQGKGFVVRRMFADVEADL